MSTYRVATLNAQARFEGDGDAAVEAIARRVLASQPAAPAGAPAQSVSLMQVDVTLPPYNADPTGARDSRKAIQDAIDAVAARGGGTVYLPAGTYRVEDPYIELKGFVLVRGAGMNSTQIIAQPRKPVTGEAAQDMVGVFHTGSWLTRKKDASMLRFGVTDLMIRSHRSGVQIQAPLDGVYGVLFNTDLGKDPADPDCVATLNFVEVWGMEVGIAIIGNDDQAMKCFGLKVRHSKKAGLIVGKPPGHPEGDAGAADNKFFGADIGGSNQGGGDHAGIEIYTSQTKFTNSTSWYTHSNTTVEKLYCLEGGKSDMEMGGPKNPNREAQKNGAGWYIAATKCTFTGCEAQENGGHGFILRYGDSALVGCRGESSSYAPTQANATAKNKAADFYVCDAGAGHTIITSCTAALVRPSEGGARWGFYVEGWVNNLDIAHCTTVGIPNPPGAEHPVRLWRELGDNVYVQVDKFTKSTRPKERDKADPVKSYPIVPVEGVTSEEGRSYIAIDPNTGYGFVRLEMTSTMDFADGAVIANLPAEAPAPQFTVNGLASKGSVWIPQDTREVKHYGAATTGAKIQVTVPAFFKVS